MKFSHTRSKVCPLCEDKLSRAHPYLREWFTTKIKPKFPQAHVSWSYRGEADQNAFFAADKTKLRFPDSKHNATVDGKPCARALDLFELVDNGTARYSPAFFFSINQQNEHFGEPLKWGGTFKNFGDGDHFELLDMVK
jgi:hypothetical protein